MKRKIVIIILLLILIAIGTLGYFFIDSIKEDQAITKEKAKEITEEYTKFDEAINQFANLREQLYVTKENTYLEEFAKEYENWNKFIADYEKTIKDVEDNTKVLKENCTVKFADIRVQSKCTNFKANYEAAMNYYITDIKSYNKTVKQYNDWVDENKYNYGKLNEGTFPVYKKYIDYDKDGEYFGKAEEKNEWWTTIFRTWKK